MSRYWLSWESPCEDYRPLTYPPQKAILGWWCSGYNSDDYAIICACVQAESEESAKSEIAKEWPESVGAHWRFCNDKGPAFAPGGRFPLADWMVERLKT